MEEGYLAGGRSYACRRGVALLEGCLDRVKVRVRVRAEVRVRVM